MKKSEVRVLSLGYFTKLFFSGVSPDSDGVNRRLYYANRVKEYHHIALTKTNSNFKEAKLENIHAYPSHGKSTLQALWNMYWLGCELIKRHNLNFIQVQDPNLVGIIGFILKLRFGIKLGVYVYGTNPWDEYWKQTSKAHIILASLAKKVLKSANAIVTDGQIIFDSLVKAGIDKNRINLVVNVPSNINKFIVKDDELRCNLLADKYESILLYVGSMIPQKNIPFLLKVFKKVLEKSPKTLLVMVGNGAKFGEYKELSNTLGINENVNWMGNIPHNTVRSYFQACDIFVLSSYYEGFPRVFIEAAICSKPIVSTRVSGTTELVIDNKTGFVVNQTDKKTFVKSIIKLLNNSGLRHKMGKEGYMRAEKYLGKSNYYNQMVVDIWNNLIEEQ